MNTVFLSQQINEQYFQPWLFSKANRGSALAVSPWPWCESRKPERARGRREETNKGDDVPTCRAGSQSIVLVHVHVHVPARLFRWFVPTSVPDRPGKLGAALGNLEWEVTLPRLGLCLCTLPSPIDIANLTGGTFHAACLNVKFTFSRAHLKRSYSNFFPYELGWKYSFIYLYPENITHVLEFSKSDHFRFNIIYTKKKY